MKHKALRSSADFNAVQYTVHREKRTLERTNSRVSFLQPHTTHPPPQFPEYFFSESSAALTVAHLQISKSYSHSRFRYICTHHIPLPRVSVMPPLLLLVLLFLCFSWMILLYNSRIAPSYFTTRTQIWATINRGKTVKFLAFNSTFPCFLTFFLKISPLLYCCSRLLIIIAHHRPFVFTARTRGEEQNTNLSLSTRLLTKRDAKLFRRDFPLALCVACLLWIRLLSFLFCTPLTTDWLDSTSSCCGKTLEKYARSGRDPMFNWERTTLRPRYEHISRWAALWLY